VFCAIAAEQITTPMSIANNLRMVVPFP